MPLRLTNPGRVRSNLRSLRSRRRRCCCPVPRHTAVVVRHPPRVINATFTSPSGSWIRHQRFGCVNQGARSGSTQTPEREVWMSAKTAGVPSRTSTSLGSSSHQSRSVHVPPKAKSSNAVTPVGLRPDPDRTGARDMAILKVDVRFAIQQDLDALAENSTRNRCHCYGPLAHRRTDRHSMPASV